MTPPTKPGHEATTYLFCTHSNYEIKCAFVAHRICRSKSFERIAFSGHTTPTTECQPSEQRAEAQKLSKSSTQT